MTSHYPKQWWPKSVCSFEYSRTSQTTYINVEILLLAKDCEAIYQRISLSPVCKEYTRKQITYIYPLSPICNHGFNIDPNVYQVRKNAPSLLCNLRLVMRTAFYTHISISATFDQYVKCFLFFSHLTFYVYVGNRSRVCIAFVTYIVLNY